MPIGARGHIGIKKEETWGTKVLLPSPDNDCFLPFISETLTPNIEEVVSAAQRAVADEPLSYQGERSFAGDIVLEVHPASIGHILRSVINEPDSGEPETVELVLDDCETAWDELIDPGVFSGLDTIDKKKGNSSVKIQVTTGVEENTILATKEISDDGIDMTDDTHIKFWIKSDVACDDAGDLVLMLSNVAECGGEEGVTMLSVDIPELVANVWKECTIALGVHAYLDAVISIGIKMVVDKGKFTLNGDDIRRISTFVAADAKQHIFIPRQYENFESDCPLNPYTLEVYRDQGNAFQFLGAVVNTLALSFGTGEKILKATCGVIAKNLGSTPMTEVGLEITDPFTWNQALISIDGSPNYDIESFGINIDNACRGLYTINQSAIPKKIIRDGYRTIPVNFVVEFTDQTEFNYFIAGTEREFQVKFEGAVIDTPIRYTLQIDLPKVKYTAYPINIGGPGRLTCAVTGKAKYDSTYGVGYAVKFTLINLQESY